MVFNWFRIQDVGLPPRLTSEYYGDRYSVPVIGANKYTGQVVCDIVYDFEDKGWCKRGLSEGMSCKNYEMPFISHFGFIPEFVNISK